jgi:hypothetical protein
VAVLSICRPNSWCCFDILFLAFESSVFLEG